MTQSRVTGNINQILVSFAKEIRATTADIRTLSDQHSAGRVTSADIRSLASFSGKARVTGNIIQTLHRVTPARKKSMQIPLSITMTDPRGILGDPHWDKVKFLFSASRGFQDCSKYKRPLNRNRIVGPFVRNWTPKYEGIPVYGTATVGTTHNPSNSLRRPPGAAPDPESFHIGKRPFCIEAWVYLNGVNSAGGIVGAYDIFDPDRGWALLIEANRPRFYGSEDGLSANLNIYPVNTLAINGWTHVCVERDSENNVRIYLNGVMAAKEFSDVNIRKTNANLSLFGYNSFANVLDGALDDVRVTIGASRYSSDLGFTPNSKPLPVGPVEDVPESPVTDDPYWDLVALLLRSDNKDQTDLSSYQTPHTGSFSTRVGSTQGAYLGTNTNERYNLGESIVFSGEPGQFDLSGKPFTIEIDAAYDSTAATSVAVTIPYQLRVVYGRSGIYFQRWDGTLWQDIIQTPSTSGLSVYGGTIPLTLTYDGAGTYRLYTQGFLTAVKKYLPVPEAIGDTLNIGRDTSFNIFQLRITKGVNRFDEKVIVPQEESITWFATTGPEYVPPVLPEPEYPSLIELEDPKFNDPNFDSWVTLQGGGPTRRTRFEQIGGFDNMPEGYWFLANSMTTNSHIALDTFVPLKYSEDVNNGLVKVYLDYKAAGYDFGIFAEGSVALLAIDSSMNILAATSNDTITNTKWKEQKLELALPPDTLFVRIALMSWNTDNVQGINLSPLKLTIDLLGEVHVFPRIDFPINPNDFTASIGPAPAVATISGQTYYSSIAQNNAFQSEYYRDNIVPDDWEENIDEGLTSLKFDVFTIATSADLGDGGRSWVEFYNDEDVILLERFNAKKDFKTPSRAGSSESLNVRVPAGTRKVRFGATSVKAARQALANILNYHPISYNIRLEKPAVLPPPYVPPIAPLGDDHWENVVLLISSRNGSIENLQNTALSNFFVFGIASVVQTGSMFDDENSININDAAASINNSYINVGLAPESQIGEEPFTYEMWIKKTADGSRTYNGFFSSSGGWSTWYETSGFPLRVSSSLFADGPSPYNEWVHFALTRDANGKTNLFINGAKQSRVIENEDVFPTTFDIGRASSSSVYSSWCGHVDEIRLTKGVVRYTEDFEPLRYRFPNTKGSTSEDIPVEVDSLDEFNIFIQKEDTTNVKTFDEFIIMKEEE